MIYNHRTSFCQEAQHKLFIAYKTVIRKFKLKHIGHLFYVDRAWQFINLISNPHKVLEVMHFILYSLLSRRESQLKLLYNTVFLRNSEVVSDPSAGWSQTLGPKHHLV